MKYQNGNENGVGQRVEGPEAQGRGPGEEHGCTGPVPCIDEGANKGEFGGENGVVCQ